MRDQFKKIYENNEWTYGSGEGSLPIHNLGYMEILESIIKENKIKSIIDLGCGDWQFSEFINWDGVQYDGYDLIKSIINKNRENYRESNIRFHLFSGDFNELPKADLLIAKDVLQHWSHNTINKFIPHLKKYKYSLITNCVKRSGKTKNLDIDDGEFRHLDIRLPPFNLKADELLSYTNYRPVILPWPLSRLRKFRRRWVKKVLLLHSEKL